MFSDLPSKEKKRSKQQTEVRGVIQIPGVAVKTRSHGECPDNRIEIHWPAAEDSDTREMKMYICA